MTTFDIRYTVPPNFEQLKEAFFVKESDRILYAYHPYIYNPSGIEDISKPLLHHEGVHMDRQHGGLGPLAWWKHYCENMQFRLMEELLAHRAEYVEVCKHPHTNRAQKRAYLVAISKRLASPLYGLKIRAKTVKALLPAMDDLRVMAKVLSMEGQAPLEDGLVS